MTAPDGVTVTCPKCGDLPDRFALTEPGIADAMAFYMAHWIMSHWDEINNLRHEVLQA
jgi:hypothetical protein